MGMVHINWSPCAKELRKFGVAMIVGFTIIGGAFYWRGHTSVAMGCWIFGAVNGTLGLTGTKAALPGYLAWMAVAFGMGSIVGPVLLALYYFGVITPMGLFMRLAGRDKLALRRGEDDTYWNDISLPTGKSWYERQF